MNIITSTNREMSWHDLKGVACLNALGNVLKDGDRIQVVLRNGFQTDVIATQDENGKWFFVFDDCLGDTCKFNQRDTTAGGWRDSHIRRTLSSIVYDMLPDDLRDAIVQTNIVQVIGNDHIETQDKLFLLSNTQVFGRGRYASQEPNDTQFTYFKKWRNRIATINNESRAWWLRSVRSAMGACFVLGDGAANYTDASSSIGVRPAFRLDR